MKLKIRLLLTLFCATTFYSNAQNDINGYKYILVPKKFDFQKTEDKHQLSSLTKFLFEKEGFTTLFEGEKVPKELYNNPCLGLKAVVQNNSNLFSTKVQIALTDCRSTEVFISEEGKSKVKDFKKGFHEAIRRAFESVKALNYAYDSNAASQPVAMLTKDEPVEEEVVEVVVEEKPSAPVVVSEPKEVIVQEVEESVLETKDVVKESTPTIVKETTAPKEENQTTDILYAQSRPFGFQLVDSTPKVVYILQKSSVNELYILKDKNGILHLKNGKWVAEYYENGILVQKELTIKF